MSGSERRTGVRLGVRIDTAVPEEPRLLCPVCADDYVHPKSVNVSPVQGCIGVMADADGVHVGEDAPSASAGAGSRGVSVQAVLSGRVRPPMGRTRSCFTRETR